MRGNADDKDTIDGDVEEQTDTGLRDVMSCDVMM